MTKGSEDTPVNRSTSVRQLREFIEALDRRVPQLEREGEARIAREAKALKQKALDRLAELEQTS